VTVAGFVDGTRSRGNDPVQRSVTVAPGPADTVSRGRRARRQGRTRRPRKDNSQDDNEFTHEHLLCPGHRAGVESSSRTADCAEELMALP